MATGKIQGTTYERERGRRRERGKVGRAFEQAGMHFRMQFSNNFERSFFQFFIEMTYILSHWEGKNEILK